MLAGLRSFLATSFDKKEKEYKKEREEKEEKEKKKEKVKVYIQNAADNQSKQESRVDHQSQNQNATASKQSKQNKNGALGKKKINGSHSRNLPCWLVLLCLVCLPAQAASSSTVSPLACIGPSPLEGSPDAIGGGGTAMANESSCNESAALQFAQFEDIVEWCGLGWVSPQIIFCSLWGIYLTACFTMLQLGCPRRKRRRGTRVIKKVSPRIKVARKPPYPRKCRLVGKMRKKHARLVARKKRHFLWFHRRLFARKDRFQRFLERQQQKQLFKTTDNFDKLNQTSPEERFTSQKIQWIKNLPVQGGAAGAAAARRKAKQRKQNNNMVRTLIRSLKTCLNHGNSLNSVLGFLQQMVPETPKKRKKPKPVKPVSDNEIKFWKGYPYRVDQNGWWTWVSNDHGPKQHAPNKPANNDARKPAVNPSPAKSPQENNSTWITSLRLEDWDQDPRPKLISLPRIKQQLRNEQTVDGNVTEIWTYKEVEELSLLWKSFDDPGPLTALLFGNAKDYPAVLHTRISTTRGNQGPQTEHVALLKISGKRSPWIPKSTKIAQDKLPKIERTGIRICAPSEFRSPYLPEGCTQDTPVSVIQALATATQGKVTDFTGGNWTQETRAGITQVIGFLKIKPSLANHLVTNSGKYGLFASKIGEPRVTQPRPFWVNRHENEPPQSYHQRVLQLQGTRSQPILYRFGKGHCLGFPRKDDDQDLQKIKFITVSGIPRAWTPDDVQAFLGDNEWKNLESSHKKDKIWFVKGQPTS